MASLRNPQLEIHLLRLLRSPPPLRLSSSSNLLNTRNPKFSFTQSKSFAIAKTSCRARNGDHSSVCCLGKESDREVELAVAEEIEQVPFDINLAVVLAGFAFEAYTSPPENMGRREVDAANCQTVFLSESFLREVYDGLLLIKLKKGINFPAMDPWGTSDPYAVFQLDGQVVKSKIKWAISCDKRINDLGSINLQKGILRLRYVYKWSHNVHSTNKRVGSAQLCLELRFDQFTFKSNSLFLTSDLEPLCDGEPKILIYISIRSIGEHDAWHGWWWENTSGEAFLSNNGFESAFKAIFGSDAVKVQEFVQYAFGQLKSFDDTDNKNQYFSGKPLSLESDSDVPSKQENSAENSNISVKVIDGSDVSQLRENDSTAFSELSKYKADESKSLAESQFNKSMQSNSFFWTNLSSIIHGNVLQKLGLPAPELLGWDGLDLLASIGLQAKINAEAGYIESGLASPESKGEPPSPESKNESSTSKENQSSLPDIKKLSADILRQTDSILGALMVLRTPVSSQNKDTYSTRKKENEKDSPFVKADNVSRPSMEERVTAFGKSFLDPRKNEEMKALFATAESAMEAWAMLASSLGHPSFIKSEFEKICYLDNTSTDTQVALWRDSSRRRLVVAFRGTEQAKWKDLRTDLMLVPAGLNPERVGGDSKEEVQVHSGFLSAYDSVRNRLMSLIKLSIGIVDDDFKVISKWHIYVTGHSLGGALATLLALELSSSLMARHGAIFVTMYNFGSPRVGNKRFVEIYNKKVKDSWRIVNHRDIIPTVPRLMGYCHVARPVYLAAGELRDALKNMELLADGYQGDVIGESTPDVLVGEFMKDLPFNIAVCLDSLLEEANSRTNFNGPMKGEKELIEKILETEINLFRSLRDGSALMQHMEDFYYITLLENVMSNYQTSGASNSNQVDV
ncbi:hypothetical protein Syun_029983 [Stephania yunnanensis]|uniref:C2 domain-containing protein n=1 Tax=Stephania yunnanensis TaxID=152371 RepID=A0AAP0E6M2_9MAGN